MSKQYNLAVFDSNFGSNPSNLWSSDIRDTREAIYDANESIYSAATIVELYLSFSEPDLFYRNSRRDNAANYGTYGTEGGSGSEYDHIGSIPNFKDDTSAILRPWTELHADFNNEAIRLLLVY